MLAKPCQTDLSALGIFHSQEYYQTTQRQFTRWRRTPRTHMTVAPSRCTLPAQPQGSNVNTHNYYARAHYCCTLPSHPKARVAILTSPPCSTAAVTAAAPRSPRRRAASARSPGLAAVSGRLITAACAGVTTLPGPCPVKRRVIALAAASSAATSCSTRLWRETLWSCLRSPTRT